MHIVNVVVALISVTGITDVVFKISSINRAPDAQLKGVIIQKKSAIFIDEPSSTKFKFFLLLNVIDEIPNNKYPVIFSAHGVPKSVPIEAKQKNMKFFDATCPLVSKIHREIEFFNKKKYEIVLIGHRNHPEVIGTMGQINDKINLVENTEDAKK